MPTRRMSARSRAQQIGAYANLFQAAGLIGQECADGLRDAAEKIDPVAGQDAKFYAPNPKVAPPGD